MLVSCRGSQSIIEQCLPSRISLIGLFWYWSVRCYRISFRNFLKSSVLVECAVIIRGLAKTLPTATNTVIVVATWNWGRATS